MTEEVDEIPNPLDDPAITVEMIDVVMRKPPMELTESPEDVERIVDRLRHHRERWASAQAKGKNRKAGGIGRKKKTPAAKGRDKMTDAEQAEMDDVLGDLL